MHHPMMPILLRPIPKPLPTNRTRRASPHRRTTVQRLIDMFLKIASRGVLFVAGLAGVIGVRVADVVLEVPFVG